MTRPEISELIAKVLDAWKRRDVTALASFHHEDGEVESPFAGGLARGREAIGRVYQAFFHSFPDLTMQTDEPLIDGNRVVLIARLSGTDHGGFMGMQPTGRSVDFPAILLFDLKDGLIAREHRIYDFTGLAVQVGAIKAKPV